MRCRQVDTLTDTPSALTKALDKEDIVLIKMGTDTATLSG